MELVCKNPCCNGVTVVICNTYVQTKWTGKGVGGLPAIGTGIALPQGSDYIVKNSFLDCGVGKRACLHLNKLRKGYPNQIWQTGF